MSPNQFLPSAFPDALFVTGETGTGKELIARMLHFYSPRRDKPLITVNCGAFTSEHLLASELFGHVKGAFTDAPAAKQGKFELADGGTLFLDEVSTMSMTMQIALLRTLRYGEIQKVGDEPPRSE
jgi:transcriptional regulator with GAF, ATPase, and Fis domain